MIIIDEQHWFFLLRYLSIIICMGLIFTGRIHQIYKIGLIQGISLIILRSIFSSQIKLIGLKPKFKIFNYMFIIPFFFRRNTLFLKIFRRKIYSENRVIGNLLF